MASRDDVMRAVEDLRESFAANAFLLFAMGLRLSTADYEQLYRDSVLDGPDDKKLDFFHLDLDSGCALIVQGYESADWDEVDAPSNKASDLNTSPGCWTLP